MSTRTVFIAVAVDDSKPNPIAQLDKWLDKSRNEDKVILGYTIYSSTSLSFRDVKQEVLDFLSKFKR